MTHKSIASGSRGEIIGIADFDPSAIEEDLLNGEYTLSQGTIQSLAYSVMLKKFSGIEPIFFHRSGSDFSSAVYFDAERGVYVGYGSSAINFIRESGLFPAEIFSINNVNSNHWVLLKRDLRMDGGKLDVAITEYDPFQGSHVQLLDGAASRISEDFRLDKSTIKLFFGALKRQTDGSSCGIISADYFGYLIGAPGFDLDIGDSSSEYESGAKTQRANFIRQLYDFNPSDKAVDPRHAAYKMHRDHMLYLTASHDLISEIERTNIPKFLEVLNHIASRDDLEGFQDIIKLYIEVANDVIMLQHAKHAMGDERRDNTLKTVSDFVSQIYSHVTSRENILKNSQLGGRYFVDFVDLIRAKVSENKDAYENPEFFLGLLLGMVNSQFDRYKSSKILGASLLENKIPGKPLFKSSKDGELYVVSMTRDGNIFLNPQPVRGFTDLQKKLTINPSREIKYECDSMEWNRYPVLKLKTTDLPIPDGLDFPDERFVQLAIFIAYANDLCKDRAVKDKLSDFLCYDELSNKHVILLPVEGDKKLTFLIDFDEESKEVKSIDIVQDGGLKKVDLGLRDIGLKCGSLFDSYYKKIGSAKVGSETSYQGLFNPLAFVSGAGAASGGASAGAVDEVVDDVGLSEEAEGAAQEKIKKISSELLKVINSITRDSEDLTFVSASAVRLEVKVNIMDEYTFSLNWGERFLIINKKGEILEDDEEFSDLISSSTFVIQGAPSPIVEIKPKIKCASLYEALMLKFAKDVKVSMEDFDQKEVEQFVCGVSPEIYPYFYFDNGLYSIDKNNDLYMIIKEEEGLEIIKVEAKTIIDDVHKFLLEKYNIENKEGEFLLELEELTDKGSVQLVDAMAGQAL